MIPASGSDLSAIRPRRRAQQSPSMTKDPLSCLNYIQTGLSRLPTGLARSIVVSFDLLGWLLSEAKIGTIGYVQVGPLVVKSHGRHTIR